MLDVYRSCSRSEKREVLEVFWRRDVVASERITDAALQYGPWALLCCVVLAAEPIPVLALSVGRSNALALDRRGRRGGPAARRVVVGGSVQLASTRRGSGRGLGVGARRAFDDSCRWEVVGPVVRLDGSTISRVRCGTMQL